MSDSEQEPIVRQRILDSLNGTPYRGYVAAQLDLLAAARVSGDPQTPDRHPFKDEWSFQRSMSRGNPQAGKPIAPDQQCFDCGIAFAVHGAAIPADGPQTGLREALATWHGGQLGRFGHRAGDHFDECEFCAMLHGSGFAYPTLASPAATPDTEEER